MYMYVYSSTLYGIVVCVYNTAFRMIVHVHTCYDELGMFYWSFVSLAVPANN